MLARIRPFLSGAALVWTAVVALSLLWDIAETEDTILELVKAEAQGNINKDMAYRRWAAGHGGVYVPITAETPPNPHLKHVDERDIVTPAGKELTLVNPAYMTRQVHEFNRGRYGVQGSLTSLKPIRPENAPDAWQRQALLALDRGAKQVASVTEIEGVRHLRLMRSMVTEERCLKCHEHQGYKVGDIRGGISVSVSMAGYEAIMGQHLFWEALGHGCMWLLGLLSLGVVSWLLRQRLAEQAAAEAARQELEAQLQQSQKMEAIGVLAGGIAHDFNNLLGVIMGCSDLMLLNMPEDHPLRDDINVIVRTSTKASALTRQLLAFSRKQLLEPRVIDLNELVLEMSGMFHRLLGEDIEIDLKLGPDLARTKVDPGRWSKCS